MSFVLKTSAALRVYGACVSQDTPGLRGRADVDRVQASTALRACVACVSQDTIAAL